VKRAAIDCAQDETPYGVSRDHSTVLDKAIRLTWTLRDQEDFATWHVVFLNRRAAIEIQNGVGDEGRRRVSDALVRSLRRLKERSARTGGVDRFDAECLNALIRMDGLGVHPAVVEEIFLARVRSMEAGGKAALSLSQWVRALLERVWEAENPARREHRTILRWARVVARRVVPLMNRSWGDFRMNMSCKVRLSGD
jgi:hypothetical protein